MKLFVVVYGRNKRQFLTKKLAARATSARRFRGMADGTNLKITVSRTNLVQESLRALLTITSEDLVAAPIRVNFENEVSVFTFPMILLCL